MLKENLDRFADNLATDEKDIATVIGYTDGAAIFEDDTGCVYYLLLEDPHMLEIGTVEKTAHLIPIEKADVPLRTKILIAIEEGRK